MSDRIREKKYSRSFVPASADMGDWSGIESIFDTLDSREIDTVEQLQTWMVDCGELAACISEEYHARYVAMTCQTDDSDKEKAYLDFIENIQEKCKPRWHRLNQRYVQSPARDKLPVDQYRVYDRSKETLVRLFREENVPLQTRDNTLDQKYQKLSGAMTVVYDGKEQTLQQMARYQQEPDRAIRRDTWERGASRRLVDRDSLDEIFDEMIALRTQMARNAGFQEFREYQFLVYERFDYTPRDCLAFHDAIEKVVVPLNRRIQQERSQSMGISPLRPWDLAVDVRNRPPLKPFNTVSDLYRGCSRVFHQVDPELGDQFDEMVQAGWLDTESRKGKAPGGYQATFHETRHPFIFMNAVGVHRDVETLLHEGGHAFHYLACRDQALFEYRQCSMEMAEVASMGMELLAYDHLGAFYRADDLARAKREQLEGIINTFCWIATIDAYQHWLYLNPKHTREERTRFWIALLERFGGIESWQGYEPIRESLWQRQLHLFGVPFYYIEYGIAQVGALQLWLNARADRRSAVRRYRDALALGGSRPLPELWRAADLRFDFSEATLRPLVEAIETELKLLESVC
ncbi:MAG: M3 family oligoendopeptidase [Deltaproteobacteria bacterium]|nr:M3 family oligoendopeptidase [Deltaproteobacteria bacterium]